MEGVPPEKKPLLAVYDYGMGGVWLLIDACSPAEIESKYPYLAAYETRPEWMSPEDEKQYRRDCVEQGMRWDIDAPPDGWLDELDRSKARERHQSRMFMKRFAAVLTGAAAISCSVWIWVSAGWHYAAGAFFAFNFIAFIFYSIRKRKKDRENLEIYALILCVTRFEADYPELEFVESDVRTREKDRFLIAVFYSTPEMSRGGRQYKLYEIRHDDLTPREVPKNSQ